VVKALGRHAQRPRILTLGADDLGLGAGSGTGVGAAPGGTSAQPPADARDAAAIAPHGTGLRDAVTDLERRMVLQALEQHGQQWAAAARALRIDPANLARMAKRLGIARG
jgi:anaerobic nitric oxide reductase transcription regulator